MNISVAIINIEQPLVVENTQGIIPDVPEARAQAIIGHLTIVEDDKEQAALLHSIARVNKSIIVSFINAHGMNLAWKCPNFSEGLLRSDILLRDGIGMSAMLRLLGIKGGCNMNGTDFIPRILNLFNGRKVALCGTRDPYLSKAAAKLTETGCNVVTMMDGFQPNEAYLDLLKNVGADIIILGMGMPKQEAVAVLLSQNLPKPTVIINGGAILDFWAERFPRAPRIWRKLHIEWLFRLIQEPRRLWKRYTVGGFHFVTHVLKLRNSARLTQNK